MMEEFRIDLIQMMENAGRNLAHLARERFLEGDPRGKSVLILCGTGGNGGGGLVCARRLHNWGATVTVNLTKMVKDYTGVPAHQLAILQQMGIELSTGSFPPSKLDLIIDALIGYSLKGAPRGRAADLIKLAASTKAPVLSLDVPSGLDTTTGERHIPSIEATATLTLALPKEGLRHPAAREAVGELYLGDISVPPALYAAPSLGLEVPALFAKEDVIRIQ